jgi:AcrR family transcriptional regulator
MQKNRGTSIDRPKPELRLPDPVLVGEGELAKSGRTRARVLEAAVECLAQLGYSKTTTATVAERAGLTRPAMQYHFPTRKKLVEAMVYYVMHQRSRAYYEAIEPIYGDPHFVEKSVAVAWEQLQGSLFQAYVELMAVARTDSDVGAIFHPALAEYDRSRRDIARAAFPSEVASAPWLDLRRDLLRFALEGMAQQKDLAFSPERRRAEVVAFLQALTAEPEGPALMMKAKKAVSSGKR